MPAIVAALALLAAFGCSKDSADEGTVKSGNGVVMNPGGKPQTAEQSQLSDQMSKTGAGMNAQRDKDAQAMAAAKARAGAK